MLCRVSQAWGRVGPTPPQPMVKVGSEAARAPIRWQGLGSQETRVESTVFSCRNSLHRCNKPCNKQLWGTAICSDPKLIEIGSLCADFCQLPRFYSKLIIQLLIRVFSGIGMHSAGNDLFHVFIIFFLCLSAAIWFPPLSLWPTWGFLFRTTSTLGSTMQHAFT